MAYHSLGFLAFCLLVFLVYFLIPKRMQWVWLLISSLAFYALSSWRTSVFLLFSILSVYTGGRLLHGYNMMQEAYLKGNGAEASKEEKKKFKDSIVHKKRCVLALVVAANAAILITFKFGQVVLFQLNSWFASGTVSGIAFSMRWILPLGISFYTLQAVGYMMDIYRGKYAAEGNVGKIALFLSFFPIITQGPISRYDQLAPQLFQPHSYDARQAKFGIQLMMFGLLKKMVLADRLGIFVTSVFSNFPQYQGFYIAVGIVFYTIQIYCDFSGGIDIVSGFSQTLGIQLEKNFAQPYLSRSIPEFWRRWHITLGAWFKDYLFYPLSLSKGAAKLGKLIRRKLGTKWGKVLPAYATLAVVWVSNGIWHGSGWQYVLFGAYHGILTILGMQLKPASERVIQRLHIRTDCFSWRLFQVLRTFGLVCLGRILYKAPSVTESFQMLRSMFSATNLHVLFDGSLFSLGMSKADFQVAMLGSLILLAISLVQQKISVRVWLEKQNSVFRYALYVAAFVSILLFGIYGPEYNATGFIYGRY